MDLCKKNTIIVHTIYAPSIDADQADESKWL